MGFKNLKYLKKWQNDCDGALAIEFSMLAVPFMLTAVAIIEMAIYFAASILIHEGMLDASRMVRTGSLQSSGSVEQQREAFLDAVCDRADMFVDCNDFQYQVRKLSSFSDNITPVLNEEGDLADPALFEGDQITAGCIGLLRVMYPYTFMTPVFREFFGDGSADSGRRNIISNIILQAEPYDFEEAENCSV